MTYPTGNKDGAWMKNPFLMGEAPSVDSNGFSNAHFPLVKWQNTGGPWFIATYRAPADPADDALTGLDTSKVRPWQRSVHYDNYFTFESDADNVLAGDPIYYMRGMSPQCQDTVYVGTVQNTDDNNHWEKGRMFGQVNYPYAGLWWPNWEIPYTRHTLGGGIDILGHGHNVMPFMPTDESYGSLTDHPDLVSEHLSMDFLGTGTSVGSLTLNNTFGLGRWQDKAGFHPRSIHTASHPGWFPYDSGFPDRRFRQYGSNTGSIGLIARGTGTSFSSPHIAGVACLYLQMNPEATAQDYKKYLTYNAKNVKLSSSNFNKSFTQSKDPIDSWRMRGIEGATGTGDGSGAQEEPGQFFGMDVFGKRYARLGIEIAPRAYGLTTQSAVYFPNHSPFKGKRKATIRRK